MGVHLRPTGRRKEKKGRGAFALRPKRFLLLELLFYAASAHQARPVIAGIERVDAYSSAATARMHKLALARVDPYMGDAPASSMEEDQVAGFHVVTLHPAPVRELRGRIVRKADALLPINVAGEPRAIESVPPGRAKPIGRTAIAISHADYVCLCGWCIGFRSRTVPPVMRPTAGTAPARGRVMSGPTIPMA